MLRSLFRPTGQFVSTASCTTAPLTLSSSRTFKPLIQSRSKKVVRRPIRPADDAITPEQWAALKKPYVGTKVKPAIEDRLPRGRYMMRLLKMEEKERILKKYPRQMDDFQTGDAICITKYISLHKEKVQKFRGIVMGRRGGSQLNASVRLRCLINETAFEMFLPLYSPFIQKIELLHSARKKRGGRKQRPELRDVPTPTFITTYGRLLSEKRAAAKAAESK